MYVGIQVGTEVVKPVHQVRDLGVVVDENLACDRHVAKVCSTGFFHLRNIMRIRKYLTHDAVCSVIHAFITSHIDYCNSLLGGLPSHLIKKVQRLQNAAARVVFNLKKHDHITLSLQQLHWLPVKYRIDFKVILLVFKALHNMAPTYIKDMIKRKQETRYSLRSNKAILLQVPRFKCVTLGRRSFAINGPTLWNSLPHNIQTIESLDVFKKELKSYLFSKIAN